MNKIKNNLKLILSDKYTNILVAILTVYIFYNIIVWYVPKADRHLTYNQVIYSIECAYIYFVMILFVVNQCLYRFKKSQFEELMKVNTAKNGYLYYWISLNIINILTTTIMTVIIVIMSSMHNNFTLQYCWYIVRIIALYFFLPGVLAIILGMLLTCFNKRIISVIAMVVIACIVNSSILIDLSHNIKVDKLLIELLKFLPSKIEYTKPLYAYPIELFDWCRISILIIGAFIIFANIYISNKKLLINIISICLLFSMVLLYKEEEKSELLGDLFYTDYIEVLEEQNYNITSYDMDIKIRNDLTVDCTMTPDNTKLEEYRFTLYHTFKVSKVYNQSDNELTFEQNGDHIKVFSDGNDIEKIRMIYQGKVNVYYADRDATYLSGIFPYYPYAGTYNIQTYKSLGKVELPPISTGDPEKDKEINANRGNELKMPQFGILKSPQKANFKVNIDSYMKIYSNLSSNGYNTFEGNTDRLFIIGGFLKEIQVKDITIVYPYLSEIEYTKEKLEKMITEFYEYEKEYSTDYTISGKKIFIHEYHHPTSIERANFENDYVELYSKKMDIYYKDFLKKKQEEKK
ncbi:MAG: hypothetical protein E7252_01485 [Lachnospira sp.]|nr:hypothetical protein [Lachnospira sp.]